MPSRERLKANLVAYFGRRPKKIWHMRSSLIQFKNNRRFHGWHTWIFVTVGICLFPTYARARVSFEALRRDGYGAVQIDRPEPNLLTVLATINGRRSHLILDTGWSGEGITLRADYGKSLGSAVQAAKIFGTSAGGHALAFQQGKADTVMLGNVLMRNVP